MTTRITRVKAQFAKPFQLEGMSRPAPPGIYELTTEEKPLGDTMIPAYRRVSSTIYIPLPPGKIGLGQILEVDPTAVAKLVVPTADAFDILRIDEARPELENAQRLEL